MRAILFDLDETLIPEDQPLHAAYLAVARALGHEDVAGLRAGLRALWQEAPAPEYRARVDVSASDGLIATFAGPGEERAAIRAFLPRFRAQAFPDPALVELWRRERVARQTVYPGAAELLRDLHARHRLALVTNGASDLQRTKLGLSGLAGHFDAVVVSSDVGRAKPDPAIFAAALEALGVDAADALMVGNDRERDVAGAQGAGVRALWVQHGAADGALASLADVSWALAGT